MAEFNKEDLLKVAKLSALELSENELVTFEDQLKKVLGFVDQITQIKVENNFEQVRNINIFREDVAVPRNSAEIIQQSPQHQLNYFVVPKILNDNKGA